METAERRRLRHRLGRIAFWGATLVVVGELTAGAVWNLVPIAWAEVQLRHLGYPDYLVYVLGAWQAAAALAIIAPGFGRVKEWAYAGAFFLWSGAVISHLVVGDGIKNWGVPLVFALCAIASRALRPEEPTDARRPGAWLIPVGLLALMLAFSLLTLPAVEEMTHRWALDYGWISE
jgi:hypothetical protein